MAKLHLQDCKKKNGKIIIEVDAVDYYDGPLYGKDSTGREWYKEPEDGDIWTSTDLLYQLTMDEVEEIWIGK